MRDYDLIADWYSSDRGRTFGVPEALALTGALPAGSHILDLGCGNGVPITRALVDAGHRVLGLDSSAGMALANVSRVLKPGAPFLFTATEIDGTGKSGITGTMNGVTFTYYAVPSYQALVLEHGMVLLAIHDDPGVNTYYLAQKL